MKALLDLTKYLDSVIGKALITHKQALAISIPYILAEEFPDLNILYLKNNIICLEDPSGIRWKVCCSTSNTFDIAPSFTKGCSRNKYGISPKNDLISEGFTGIIFVNFKTISRCEVTFRYIKDCNIGSKGEVFIE